MNTEQKKNDDEKNITQTNTKEENQESFDFFQNQKINNLTLQLLQNKKKIDEIELRTLAKIDNIKKSTQEQIKKIQNLETETFLKKIIPIINSLEEISLFSSTLNIKNQPFIQGIELTLNSLFNILLKLGVIIEGKKNEIFNSDLHHIVSTEKSEKILDNHILAVHKKGLTFNKILLRKASVTVGKK